MNKATSDQIASIMLQYGSPAQQLEVIEMCSIGAERMTINPHDHPNSPIYKWTSTEIFWIEQKIAEAVAKERERCAKVCESGINSTSSYRWEIAVNWCADAIRRGE